MNIIDLKTNEILCNFICETWGPFVYYKKERAGLIDIIYSPYQSTVISVAKECFQLKILELASLKCYTLPEFLYKDICNNRCRIVEIKHERSFSLTAFDKAWECQYINPIIHIISNEELPDRNYLLKSVDGLSASVKCDVYSNLPIELTPVTAEYGAFAYYVMLQNKEALYKYVKQYYRDIPYWQWRDLVYLAFMTKGRKDELLKYISYIPKNIVKQYKLGNLTDLDKKVTVTEISNGAESFKVKTKTEAIAPGCFRVDFDVSKFDEGDLYD